MQSVLGERFAEALAYAARAHAGQRRKGSGAPYVAHLLGVASLALMHGADEDEAIAALLHDTAEDQGGRERLDDVGERFGAMVASIVDACSDNLESTVSWRVRKETHLRRMLSANTSTLLVFAADKLENVTTLVHDLRAHGPATWTKFNGGREGTLWYYAEVETVLRAAPAADARVRALLEAFSRMRHEVTALEAQG